MSIHLRRNGRWQTCTLPEGTCQLPCHLEDMTVEAARLLPEAFVEQLFAAIDPPLTPAQAYGWENSSWPDATPTVWAERGRDGTLHGHREFGLPAVIYANGDRFWQQHGLLHRNGDKPAVVRLDGNGRTVLPAREAETGQQTVIVLTGTLEWWRNGQLSRQDGPAVINATAGYQAWWRRGKRHRDGDKPAVVYADGSVEYWRHGRFIAEGDSPTPVDRIAP